MEPTTQMEKMKLLHQQFKDEKKAWGMERIKAESNNDSMRASAYLQQEILFTNLIRITAVLIES